MFKLGSIERFLFVMLRRVGAIAGEFDIRPSDKVIRKKLQSCLDKITKVVKRKKNKPCMDVIEQALKA